MPDTFEMDCFFFQWSLRTLTIFHHSTEFREQEKDTRSYLVLQHY